jgi:hypothetical protein
MATEDITNGEGIHLEDYKKSGVIYQKQENN